MMTKKQGLFGLLTIAFILVSGHFYKDFVNNNKINQQTGISSINVHQNVHNAMIEEQFYDCGFFPEYPTDCIMVA